MTDFLQNPVFHGAAQFVIVSVWVFHGLYSKLLNGMRATERPSQQIRTQKLLTHTFSYDWEIQSLRPCLESKADCKRTACEIEIRVQSPAPHRADLHVVIPAEKRERLPACDAR